MEPLGSLGTRLLWTQGLKLSRNHWGAWGLDYEGAWGLGCGWAEGLGYGGAWLTATCDLRLALIPSLGLVSCSRSTKGWGSGLVPVLRWVAFTVGKWYTTILDLNAVNISTRNQSNERNYSFTVVYHNCSNQMTMMTPYDISVVAMSRYCELWTLPHEPWRILALPLNVPSVALKPTHTHVSVACSRRKWVVLLHTVYVTQHPPGLQWVFRMKMYRSVSLFYGCYCYPTYPMPNISI